MIKQEVFLNQNKLLTIYHEGFADYPVDRKISQSKIIDDYKLEFKESYLETIEDEKITYDEKLTGFLERENKKNPYSSYCCSYIEFINYNKKEIIDEFLKKKETFNKISDFIRKWTGLNLQRTPYLINNYLFYKPKPFQLEISLDDSDVQDKVKFEIVENEYQDLNYIVKFKVNDLVVDTKTYNQDTKIISSNKEWNLLDLEVYTKDNELIYANYDISFICSINIDMNLVSNAGTKELNRSNKEVDLKHYSSEPLEIGETNVKRITNYLYQEKAIAEQFKEKSLFEFLTEDEYEKALDIFEDIADSSSYDELWIFDPHAIDYDINGKEKLEDLYTVLANTVSLKKYIIFEPENKDEDKKDKFEQEFNEFLSSIENLQNIAKKSNFDALNFTFYGTKKHFHDRFIFLRKDKDLKGYVIGTSLNSFGDNYSIIMELEKREADFIFNKFNDEIIKDENVILEKEI